jgi:hypothetical protein
MVTGKGSSDGMGRVQISDTELKSAINWFFGAGGKLGKENAEDRFLGRAGGHAKFGRWD